MDIKKKRKKDGFVTTENFVRSMDINKVCRQSLDGSGMFEAQQIDHFLKVKLYISYGNSEEIVGSV
jgi:hypothetical protein